MKIEIESIAKLNTFISIFHQLKNSSSSATMIFNPDHVHIQGMDKSHVCLYDVKLTASWFLLYDAGGSESNYITVNTNIFHMIISTVKDGEKLVLQVEDKDSEHINIEVIGGCNNYFQVCLLDIEPELYTIPETEYDVELRLGSKKMHDITSRMLYFGDTMNISCNSDQITLKTTGVEGSMSSHIQPDDSEQFAIQENINVSLSYSLNYLHKICLTTKLSEYIDFSISETSPMKIGYDLGDNSVFFFYLAPKDDN
jgi:proliferating cell nuclear antigen PCNA